MEHCRKFGLNDGDDGDEVIPTTSITRRQNRIHKDRTTTEWTTTAITLFGCHRAYLSSWSYS